MFAGPRLGTAIAGAAAMLATLASCAGEAARADAKAASGDVPTIVSLNPCTDAILVEVAEPDQILALSHYSGIAGSSSISPEVAARFAKTGGTAEEVLALKPDIVLASQFMAPSLRAALERLDVQVETFGSPLTPRESYDQIEQIAQLSRRPERAEALIADIKTALNKASIGADAQPIEALLWQSGQIVAGDGALVTEVLRETGFVRGEGMRQGEYVSLERLIADPPELVLIAGTSAGQQHPALSQLDASRFASLDPKLFYCAGPSLIALAQRLVAIRAEITRDKIAGEAE